MLLMYLNIMSIKIKIGDNFDPYNKNLFKIKQYGKRNKYYYYNIILTCYITINFDCETCNKNIERTIKTKKLIDFIFTCYSCKNKQTKLERYGNENYNNRKKEKQTKLERYGNENYNNMDKNKQTCLARYGKECTLSVDIFKNKIKQTNLKKYGVEYITQDKEKMKQGMINKYGVVHSSKLGFVKQKKEQTCLRNYGVKYPSQNNIINQKQLSSFGQSQRLKQINENLHYQNKSELSFINWCQTNNIEVWDGPSIPYFLDGKKHIYHIDFETDVEIIEIKGNHHWYKEDLESGKIEAKNRAAEEYAKKLNKKFKFLLDIF